MLNAIFESAELLNLNASKIYSMEAEIVVAIITVSGSLVIAAATFFLTKSHQIQMEWQQKKINHYKELLSAMSDLAVDGIDKEDANIRFAHSVNTIVLVAPQKVITALMEFHNEIKYSNPSTSVEKHDRLLKALILAIREDINITSKDDKETFNFHLIGSAPKRKRS